jgi:hypothetical protein
MSEIERPAQNETIESQLRLLAEEEGAVVLYVSFGVVKGRLAPSLIREPSGRNGDVLSSTRSIIEITDATVEHYHSHLPTASFGRLFIRTGDIHGFALGSSQSQG